MQRSRFHRLGAFLPTLILTPALLLGACGAGDESGQPPAGEPAAQPLTASAQSMVDSGNLAYRGGDYEAALDHFRSALEEAPRHPVPLFGVHLAATALGEATLADSVAAILREEAPWLLGMTQHTEGGAAPDPHAGMGETSDPHAGMIMAPVPDSQADTTR